MEVVVDLQEGLTDNVFQCTQVSLVAGNNCNPVYTGTDYTWDEISAVQVYIVAQPSDNSFANAENVLSEEDLSLRQRFFPRNRFSF